MKSFIAIIILSCAVVILCGCWMYSLTEIKAYREQIIALSEELEQKENSIQLEDRFSNLMESLSDDNGVMKYDVDINAKLFSDDMPDTVSLILHLKEGQVVK